MNRTTSLPQEITQAIRNGSILAGDDFTGDRLTVWFAQEEEAFFKDDHGSSESDPWYCYMRQLNQRLGFGKLPRVDGAPLSMLVLGPGSGIEIAGLAAHGAWRFLFVEASRNFQQMLRTTYPQAHIVGAQASGDIDAQSGSLQAACAFSVLHHIPNVSHVLAEVCRVLSPEGIFLVREPCSSMGDWRYPRHATPNERGISSRLLTEMALSAGFELVSGPTPVLFSPLNVLFRRLLGGRLMKSATFYWLDRAISYAVSWNEHYWRDAWYKRLGPSAYFYVFGKTAHRGTSGP